jgi:hypothetical protein
MVEVGRIELKAMALKHSRTTSTTVTRYYNVDAVNMAVSLRSSWVLMIVISFLVMTTTQM